MDTDLFASLRALRRQIAQEIGKPPYVVFNDNTLREMARIKPTTRAEMLDVTGVGEAKMRAFGERFLEAIRNSRVNRQWPGGFNPEGGYEPAPSPRSPACSR